VNIDGTDYAAFCGDQGKRIKLMPSTTPNGLAVFVEGDQVPWDGAGTLGCVQLRRPLHQYRALTQNEAGLFHSPWGLPDGRLLVSRRSRDKDDTHGLYTLDLEAGECELVYDSPEYHEIQARPICERAEPDGRSSVVTEDDPYGKLYCMNAHLSDFKDSTWLPAGTAQRVRILEGLARTDRASGLPQLAQRRLLGDIDLNRDGSFNIEVPASIPIEIQTLDAHGMALRTCSWIWAKNHEPRGCIGCHEDGELTPENILIDALTRDSLQLTLPPAKRRTVDFRRDVMPIVAAKCASCHDKADATVRLSGDMTPGADRTPFNLSYVTLLASGPDPHQGRYVHPGEARTSPLIWHLFGRNTSRPWDGDTRGQAVAQMPQGSSVVLTENDKQTFVEWIDMGALWNGIPEGEEEGGQTGGHQP
jgi:hypothetical protein